LTCQRTRIFDLLLADTAELRISGRIVDIGGKRAQYAARAEPLPVLRIFLPRIIELLGLFFRIQVIEIAEPVVEPVYCRQELVTVTEVVLAELCRGVTFSLEHFGKGRIAFLNPAGRAGDTDRRHSGPDRQLSHDECRAPSSAAGLTIVIG